MASSISLDLEEMSARVQKSLSALAELPQHSVVAQSEGVGVGVTANFRSVVTQAASFLAAETDKLRRSLQQLHDDLTAAIEHAAKVDSAVAAESAQLLKAIDAIDQGPMPGLGAAQPHTTTAPASAPSVGSDAGTIT